MFFLMFERGSFGCANLWNKSIGKLNLNSVAELPLPYTILAKTKTIFFCTECGFESSKWIGKCPSCNQWNSFKEETRIKQTSSPTGWSNRNADSQISPINILEIAAEKLQRIALPDKELERVLGGGIVPGSVVLLGGEPGIGKSTLLLQLALQLNQTVMYISGEESEEQIKIRAERTGMVASHCLVFTQTNVEKILPVLEETKPALVVIDSIQTLYTDSVESAPGSISQIRETTALLLRFAKENNVPVFLIGHITKDGSIAGPKLLEHMVDTVLQFEGDRHYVYRLLRTLKNRFGSTNEMGIYEMNAQGLEGVANPSQVLMAQRDDLLSGISVTAALEGMRPLMLETQALVSTAVYGTPQRTSTGFDARRLNMLLAVLEKRCGFRLGTQDVFVNIAGGLRIEDPGMDLGIMAAIMSSYQNVSIPATTVFAAEIGLSGELRPVQRIDMRIAEAQKLGMKEIVVSKYNKFSSKPEGISVKLFSKVDEVFEWVFG